MLKGKSDLQPDEEILRFLIQALRKTPNESGLKDNDDIFAN